MDVDIEGDEFESATGWEYDTFSNNSTHVLSTSRICCSHQ